MIEQIREATASIKLDTLLEKERLNIVHFPHPEDPKRSMKMMFSKNQTIGMVVDDVLYILPEYYKGGKHFNIFFEREANLVVKTYGLKKHCALEMDALLGPKMDRLIEIHKQAQTEVNLEELELLNTEAESLAFELQNDEATKMYNEIDAKYIKMLDAVKPENSEKIAKLNELIEKAKDVKDMQEFEPIFKEAGEILATITDEKEKKKLSDMLTQKVIELQGSGSSGGAAEVITTQTVINQAEIDRINRDYLKLIKDGDKLFDKKKYKEALPVYEEAIKLKPEMKHPNKRIAELQTLIKK